MTQGGTQTFLVGRSRPVVIDPGPDDPQHLRAIERALEGVPPHAILLTHGHSDHAGCARALGERTGAPIMMGVGGSPGPLADAVARWLGEGDRVETDEGEVRAVATPGHTPEHLAFLWPEGSALFVGDLLMGIGDTTLVAPPEGDLAAYLASLRALLPLEVEVLFPAHGPPLFDPPRAISRYLRHRMKRIEQVRAAVRPDVADLSLEAIVRGVYGTGLDPALRGAAEGSIRAVLAFLERNGESVRRPGMSAEPVR